MNDALLDRDFSVQKLRSVIQTIDTILGGFFPYEDSRTALIRIRALFVSLTEELESIDSDQDASITQQYCRDANSQIFFYKGFIGFLLRSSNLRNSFEAYSSIKDVADQLLGGSIKVVLSSEWNFSPFIYPIPSRELADFILVGFPASESQNSLILPLAGHELGHAIWRRSKIDAEYYKLIEKKTVEVATTKWQEIETIFRSGVQASDVETNIISRAVWQISYTYAKRQVEEIFCDTVGVWIFGTSFLHAFRYLIAPNIGHRRSPYYPQVRKRAEYIVKAAKHYGYDCPADYITFFAEREGAGVGPKVLVDTADLVSESFVDQLIDRVNKYCSVEKKVIGISTDGMESAEQAFLDLVPVPGYRSIGDILNAAWRVRLKLSNWSIPGVDDNRKIHILNDLVFKSFEVSEYNKLLKEYDARKSKHTR